MKSSTKKAIVAMCISAGAGIMAYACCHAANPFICLISTGNGCVTGSWTGYLTITEDYYSSSTASDTIDGQVAVQVNGVPQVVYVYDCNGNYLYESIRIDPVPRRCFPEGSTTLNYVTLYPDFSDCNYEYGPTLCVPYAITY